MASALRKLAIISPPLDLSLTRPRVSFSPDGRYLAVVSTNGHVEIWKVEWGAVTQLTKWSSVQAFVDNYITNVIWSPSQNHLLVTSNHSAELFDVKTGERVINLGPVTSASFLSDSAELAFIAMPGRVFFQNLRSRQASQYIVSLDEEVVDISISPDNERIIGITMTELRVYHRGNAGLVLEGSVSLLNEIQVISRRVSLARNGGFALIWYQACDPEVWRIDTAGGIKLTPLPRYSLPTAGTRWYNKVQFGGLNDELIIALCDLNVHIWDRDSARLLHSFHVRHGHGNRDLSFTWNSTDPKDMVVALTSSTANDDASSLQLWSVLPQGLVHDPVASSGTAS
ncbi:hypothetical protein FRC03_004570 [Tulasnella sp. 419]|nr:hypothetical protein FRC03_004570 [Tulasnella sp. 419]